LSGYMLLLSDDPLPPPPITQLHPSGPKLQSSFPQQAVSNGDWIPRNYIEKGAKHECIKISEVFSTNFANLARVIYAYEANRPDELSLNENEIVFILRKNDDGWFEGVSGGLTGLFPGNIYVIIYVILFIVSCRGLFNYCCFRKLCSNVGGALVGPIPTRILLAVHRIVGNKGSRISSTQ